MRLSRLALGLVLTVLLSLAPESTQAHHRALHRTSRHYPVIPAHLHPACPPMYLAPAYPPAPAFYMPSAEHPATPTPATVTPATHAPATSPPGRSSYPPPFPPAPVTTASIALRDDSFEPNVLTVTAGTTIRWTNYGKQNHTVTAAEDRWDSADLGPGKTYSVTLWAPGTYEYSCRYHKEMRGTIIVQ